MKHGVFHKPAQPKPRPINHPNERSGVVPATVALPARVEITKTLWTLLDGLAHDSIPDLRFNLRLFNLRAIAVMLTP